MSASAVPLLLLALVSVASAYRLSDVQQLNGHNYTIVENQPFFRVYHRPHFKVSRPGMPPGLNSAAMMFDQQAPQHTLFSPFMALFASMKASAYPQFLIPPGIAAREQADGVVDNNQEYDNDNDGEIKRSKPKFGHHHLPPGENQLGAQWPHWLRPYLTCMSLSCQCQLFNGTVEHNAAIDDSRADEALCRLPSGRFLRKTVRKEYRTLKSAERQQFLHFLQRMKSEGLYNTFGLIHRKRGVHAGPGFFPWHREFLKRLEMAYRTLNPEQGLPYWDSTLDNNLPEPADSVMFSDALMGDTDNEGNVVSGPFANWSTIDGRKTFVREFGVQKDGELFNDARIDFVLNQTNVDRVLAFSLPLHTCIKYDLDDRFLEYSHDYAHYFIAGDMLERFSSSNDPIFFMHHAFVDSIWEMWRQNKQTRNERENAYPRDDGECMPVWHFSNSPMSGLEPMTNHNGLSNAYTDNLYEYAPRPVCRRHSSECASEFLFCDTVSDASWPKCTAKVKRGGKCAGFEWSREVCYAPDEACVEGRCVPVDNDDKVRRGARDGDNTNGVPLLPRSFM